MYEIDAQRDRYIALLLRLGQRIEQGRYRQIYCNRDIHHDLVKWIGFDMDYTIAVYFRERIDELAHRLTVDRLALRFGYPTKVRGIAFDPTFAIRGLTVDRQTGNILKIDRHRHVVRAYHGFQPVPAEQMEAYRRRPPSMSDKRYRMIDTLFELPEAAIFAAVVELLEADGVAVDFGKLVDDIREAIDSIHADGSLKGQMIKELAFYIQKDPHLGATLHRFRSAGKKLFLMTNSYAEYTNHVMTYLLEDGPADYKDWRGYFDVIVTGASKPSFFRSQNPFLVLDESGNVLGEERQMLRRGVVYQHGNLADFERMIGVRADEILYVGDHIYGDIVRSKLDSGWRTAMILPELETELRTLDHAADDVSEWKRIEAELAQLRDAQALEAELKYRLKSDDPALEGLAAEEREEMESAIATMDRNSDRLDRRRKELIARVRELEIEVDTRFHPRWGALMKAGNEHSMFGEQVERYACLYTSRVTNFLAYSPTQYQRSPRDHMPHEAHFDAR